MFTACSDGIAPATMDRGVCCPDIESQKAYQDPEAAASQASEHEHPRGEILTQPSRRVRDSAASLFASFKKRKSADLEEMILTYLPSDPDEDERPAPRLLAGGIRRETSSSSFSSTVTDVSSKSLIQGHYSTQLTQGMVLDQNGVDRGLGTASLQESRQAGTVHAAAWPASSDATKKIEDRLGNTERSANPHHV